MQHKEKIDRLNDKESLCDSCTYCGIHEWSGTYWQPPEFEYKCTASNGLGDLPEGEDCTEYVEGEPEYY